MTKNTEGPTHRGRVAQLRRDRETPAFSLEYDGGTISGPDEASVREVVASLEEGKRRAARWPEDGPSRMAALARLFPSMRGVPGTDPWNVEALIAWTQTGAPTSGSGWAARFLLSVWNPSTNWSEHGVPGAGKFDLMEAWDSFDDQHRAAVMQWLAAPFWP
jgi:hypothetical protein